MPTAPELRPPVRVLMGPGPSDIHPRVLSALAKGTVGHLDPYFLQVMDGVQQMLREVFRTQNRNDVRRQRHRFGRHGSGGRQSDRAGRHDGRLRQRRLRRPHGRRRRRAGAEVTKVERPWGEVFTAE